MTAADLQAEIARFVRESEANRFSSGQSYFEEPLVGFASAQDPLFEEYKQIIGDFHRTPRELFEHAFGPGSFAGGTVVAWILPISAETRLSNRLEDRRPSERWARTRDGGERFNALLRQRVVDVLQAQGYRSFAPLASPLFKLTTSPVGRTSTWSERHAAYAAGLGTFSLNDGLITPKGIAHRVGSVLTELVLPASERSYPDHRANCLFFQEAGCGACIERCPAGALSEQGHDKVRCKQYLEGLTEELGPGWQITRETGCGLCQTGVPCESRIPARARGRAGDCD